MNRDKLSRLLGYGGFGVFAFVVSMYLTFPAEAVGQRLGFEISRVTRGAVTASFGDVGPYRLTGVEAEDVELIWTRRGKEPLTIPIDSLQARVEILPLFLLQISVVGSIELGEGSIDAEVAPGEGGFEASLELEDLNFASPPIVPKLADIPINGTISGKADINWAKDPRKSAGQASLTITGSGFGPGELASGFTIPSNIGLGQLDLALKLRAGKMSLASFKQNAGEGSRVDLEIKDADVTFTIDRSIAKSSYDVCVQLKFDEDFLKKNPKLDSITSLATAYVRKDPEGFLHVPVKGTLRSMPRPRRRLCSKAR